MRCFIIFLSSLLIYSNGIHAQNTIEKELFGQVWTKAHSYKNTVKGESIQEWVPKGQNVNNFQEMVVISKLNLAKLPNPPKTAVDFVEFLKYRTAEAYPKDSVSWSILRTDTNDMMFEWKLLKQYQGTPPEHNLSRIIFDKDTMLQIIYTKKINAIDPNLRKKWIDWIENLIKNQPNKT